MCRPSMWKDKPFPWPSFLSQSLIGLTRNMFVQANALCEHFQLNQSDEHNFQRMSMQNNLISQSKNLKCNNMVLDITWQLPLPAIDRTKHFSGEENAVRPICFQVKYVTLAHPQLAVFPLSNYVNKQLLADKSKIYKRITNINFRVAVA